MNKTEKNILIALTGVAWALTARYGFSEEPGVKVPGLTVKHSKKFILGLAALGTVVLVASALKTQPA